MMNCEKELARSVLTSLRGDLDMAMKEIGRIEQNAAKQKQIVGTDDGSSSIMRKWEILSKGTFIRPFLVVIILLSISWHWTGGPIIGFYTIDIIEAFNIPMNPHWCAVLIACFQLFYGVIANVLSSIIPRRKLFMGCGVLTTIGTLVLGTCVYLSRKVYFIEFLKHYPLVSWTPLIGIIGFYAGYFGGYVSVCFIFLAELLPSNARNIGSSMATACSILSLFILVKIAPTIQDSIGLDGLFWLFSGVTSCSIVFCYCFVPETFGKTLESIEDHYRNICYGNQVTPKRKIETITESGEEYTTYVSKL